MELLLYPLTFVVGLFVGATGIGGVALAPAMDAWMGVSTGTAVAIAMASFVASGAVGTLTYQLRGAIEWRQVPMLAGAVIVSAFAGALTLQLIPNAWLRLGLGTLMMLSGLRVLAGTRKAARHDAGTASVRPLSLAAVGIVTGWGSAITASGGPLILLPILLLMKVRIRTAVGFCQVVQVPIGLAASLGNHITGLLDLSRAVPIALILGAGTAAGALIGNTCRRGYCARRLPWRWLSPVSFMSAE